MKLTRQEADRLVHHLRVAANRYNDHADQVVLPHVRLSFRSQAEDARNLAALICREYELPQPTKP